MWAAVKDTAAAKGELYATLLEMDRVLGLGFADMQEQELTISEAEIQRLIAERDAARNAKDFAAGDAIRDELKAKGIILEDSPTGTVWRRC